MTIPLQKDGLKCLMNEENGAVLYFSNVDKLIADRQVQDLWDAPNVEIERASGYHDPKLARRFLGSRHLLRDVLSHHSNWPMEDLILQSGLSGKPFIDGLPVEFNLSRSGGFVAIAVSRSGKIGIDIEIGVTLDTSREVADRIFTPAEAHFANKLDDADFVDTFKRCWTLKEALIKATGEGLSRDIQEIELDLSQSSPALVRLPFDYGNLQNWRIGLVETGLPNCLLAYARYSNPESH